MVFECDFDNCECSVRSVVVFLTHTMVGILHRHIHYINKYEKKQKKEKKEEEQMNIITIYEIAPYLIKMYIITKLYEYTNAKYE